MAGRVEGMTDISPSRRPRPWLGLELKVEAGRQSLVQKQVEADFAAAGQPDALCRSIDDVHAALVAAGIPDLLNTTGRTLTMTNDPKQNEQGRQDMTSWAGLTDGQMRDLARELCVAVMKAKRSEEPPGDAWLNARLRERGCPEDQFETWREQIKVLPLRSLADGAA